MARSWYLKRASSREHAWASYRMVSPFHLSGPPPRCPSHALAGGIAAATVESASVACYASVIAYRISLSHFSWTDGVWSDWKPSHPSGQAL